MLVIDIAQAKKIAQIEKVTQRDWSLGGRVAVSANIAMVHQETPTIVDIGEQTRTQHKAWYPTNMPVV